MGYKRILTIQDISCVGQCSMTVAMPILSACGHETCILPTALLSTHTGGFGRPAITHLDGALEEIWRHWQRNGICFDAVLVGYLGSVAAIQTVLDIRNGLLAPGGVLIVDPAMADHGKLYSGFDGDYAQNMKVLCQAADWVLPNITEAALLSGIPFAQEQNAAYFDSLLRGMGLKKIVLTGTGILPEETGAILYECGKQRRCTGPMLGGSFHGTGDIFAACFTGALMCGKTAVQAVQIAVDFTALCIAKTIENPAHWYGVKFEKALPELIRMLNME